MAYFARLAVHRAQSAGHPAAENLADALMAEANSENRHAAGIVRDELHRDPRLVRRAGSGRNHDGLRFLIRQGRIIAHHLGHGAKFAQVIGHRVHKGIIVVDNEDHPANSLAPKASKIARALSSVSSNSEAGSDAVVIPPPA